MTGRLQDQTALITGGASGLGLAAAELFVAEGANVVIADRNQQAGEKIADRLGERARFISCDVTCESDIEAAVGLATRAFGGLDVTYHSAGAVGDHGTVDAITLDGWRATFALLLESSMLVLKHSIAPMRARGGGSVILTSSAAATSLGGTGTYAYSVAKGAVISLAQYAALKLAADRIRVNTLIPGAILTPIWGGLETATSAPEREFDFTRTQPLPRVGAPADTARAVLYLASDEAAFVTGVTLPVDGGLTLHRPERPYAT